MSKVCLEEVGIRNELRPGDIGRVVLMHGVLYARENGFGLQFEAYVARGLCEFVDRYDPARDRVWACEHGGRLVGFILAMHREDAAQLRYFLIEPEYRGIGLGGKLMRAFMDFARERGYRRAYLWTTEEQATAIRIYEAAGFALTEEKDSTAFGRPLKERRYDCALR